MRALISGLELAAILGRPDLRILDASWYMPAAGRDPAAEYRAAHIPGAVFFDIDAVSDRDSPYPHMLPAPEAFETQIRALGIDQASHIVVYDGGSPHAAARAWWTLRYFGHDAVQVLDGGLPNWRKAGYPLTDAPADPAAGNFTALPRPDLVRDLDQMHALVAEGGAAIVDARPAARFRGEQPEPRAGLRPGHMPGALNLPFDQLLDDDGRYLPAERMREAAMQAGVAPGDPIVATCGSGVTASVVALALHEAGLGDAAVYDGSWSEWGAQPDTPVEPQ